MDKQERKFWARMFENAPNMSSEVRQGWIENPQALQKFLLGLAHKESCLTALTSVRVEVSGYYLPDFYMNRHGLKLSVGFSNSILSEIQKQSVTNPFTSKLGYADLTKLARDPQILEELPEGHVFENVNAFLATLATLIQYQWRDDTDGTLSKVCKNIFYVKVNEEVHTVIVTWINVEQRWNCYAFSLDDGYRHVDDRVFSATTIKA